MRGHAPSMKCWLIGLVALILSAPACADDASLAPADGSGTATPESVTSEAMDSWLDALPHSMKTNVYGDVGGDDGEAIVLIVDGKSARAGRRLVRRLCPRMERALPLGNARHVEFWRETHGNVATLASLTAGGNCHMHRHNARPRSTTNQAAAGPDLTAAAMELWMRGLPQRLKAGVAWYELPEEDGEVYAGEPIYIYVDSEKARARRHLARTLCIRLANALPLGTVKHVVLMERTYSGADRLETITAGGRCRTV
jgi:hypothetical protein